MTFTPIEILRFSTADLAPDQRYAAWLGRGWPRPDAIYRTHPTEPFDTEWASAVLGEVVFVYTRITGMRYERRVRDLRVSDFDPIIVNMMMEGSARGQFDGRAFHEEAGQFHFHDITRQSDHVSTASRTFSIVIPRVVAMSAFGALDDLHGLVVDGAGAGLLIAHAEQIWRALPQLDRAAAPALGRSFLDLLTAALVPVRATWPQGARASRVRERAIALLDSRLHNPIGPDELCRELGISRTTLFEAFQSDGGVQQYMREARLERVKAALSDIDRREAIGAIAARFGYCDASHLSRKFRARYGITPREYRQGLAAQSASTNIPRRGKSAKARVSDRTQRG